MPPTCGASPLPTDRRESLHLQPTIPCAAETTRQRGQVRRKTRAVSCNASIPPKGRCCLRVKKVSSDSAGDHAPWQLARDRLLVSTGSSELFAVSECRCLCGREQSFQGDSFPWPVVNASRSQDSQTRCHLNSDMANHACSRNLCVITLPHTWYPTL